MQKKVGIITFHNSVNYGALLQTYALSKVLVNDGYNVEVIDYVNKSIERDLSSGRYQFQKSLKGCIKYLIKRVHGYRKDKSFSNFINSELYLSKERRINRDSISALSDRYDVVITGSDQVWNLNLTDNDTTYYLDFVDDGVKRIAYAVSCGDSANDLSKALSYMEKIDSLSVRERSLSTLLQEKYGISSVACTDPTLLAGKDLFKTVIRKRLIKEKYIFCFLMDNKPEMLEVARRIAKEKGLVVVDNKNSFQFFLHSSPYDYLSWIYHAEFVLTDSFHGTALSIVFNKSFASDMYDAKGQIKKRIEDLLISFGLSERFVRIDLKCYAEVVQKLNEQLDYTEIEKTRKELARISHEWLLSSIEK